MLYFLRPKDDAIMAGTGTEGQALSRPDGKKSALGGEWGDAKFHAIMKGRDFVQDPTREEVATDGKIFGY